MRSVTLREYQTTSVPELTRDEVMALARIVPDLRVTPSQVAMNAFDVTPGSWIGAVCLPGVEVQILPQDRTFKAAVLGVVCSGPGFMAK